MSSVTKKIIAVGGGGFTHSSDRELDQFILSQFSKEHLKIGFLGTASKDDQYKVNLFYERYDNQKNQLEYLKEYILKSDAVITTAAIPGRKAPILIEKSTVEEMKYGSVIVDLAASTGGNCESTELDKEIEVLGTKVIGPSTVSYTHLTLPTKRIV